MRNTLKSSIALSLAALTLVAGLAASASPASAKPIIIPHPYHGFHHGFGPWFGLGVVGAVAAAGYAADSCIEYRPIYDRWGNYLGRTAVNVCE
jgi:hypothetical protein